ncbi:MAG TPA: sulfur carrier protein ThiS [Candidatus Omnitrophota bacterium]|nr:sulfur carrier protein ThiS [Candidatus Omnitrophota bacterium]HSA30979.1 sulfur carrier protein ThiS [Candidatus Omnitrophota bacterium]
MKLTLNGKSKEIMDSSTLAAVVRDHCQNPEHVVAELNGSIIGRALWENTVLKENDRLELVSFVGGG